MTFSYNTTLATPLDQVRFMIGDRTAPGRISNEEITAQLTANNNIAVDAAIDVLTGLIAEYGAKAASPTVGPFSIDYGSVAEQYRMLLDTLQKQRTRNAPAMAYLSGYQLEQAQDGDAEPYLFDKEMMDNEYIETYEGMRSPTGYPS